MPQSLATGNLRAALDYDPATGVFIWKINRANKKIGDIAGNVGPNGYRTIMVDYRSYYAHHLAIAFRDGCFPPKGSHVDHLNGDRADNRIANLRITTPSGNLLNRQRLNRNNTTGVTGVVRDRDRGGFKAQIMINRKNHIIGRYNTLDEARAAVEAARVAAKS